MAFWQKDNQKLERVVQILLQAGSCRNGSRRLKPRVVKKELEDLGIFYQGGNFYTGEMSPVPSDAVVRAYATQTFYNPDSSDSEMDSGAGDSLSWFQPEAT